MAGKRRSSMPDEGINHIIRYCSTSWWITPCDLRRFTTDEGIRGDKDSQGSLELA